VLQINDHHRIKQKISEWKKKDYKIALVPTMGNLHAGHLALVEKAKSLADKVIVSIFVNPMQFGENEDFDSYPRTLEEDGKKLQQLNVDLLFSPPIKTMYPRSANEATYVHVPGMSEILCGEFRPTHFRGVTTIVNKLFNVLEPDIAVFGEKDFQQVVVIKQMVFDLLMSVEIVSLPTIREDDGLAMSSRNQYLDVQQRKQAAALYTVLQELKTQCQSSTDLRDLENNGKESLVSKGFEVEYLSFRNPVDLSEGDINDSSLVLLVAAWLGKTRLIDNVRIK